MREYVSYASASRATALSIGGFAMFLLLTALVHARILVGIDLATASATHVLVSAPLDSLGAVLSILFSAEISLFLALLISLLLWRQGRGLWSLAPLAILPLVGIEVGMKLIVQQPVVPAEFHRSIYYPFTSVTLSGSFPSGHAMRAGFLCTFLAVLASPCRRIVAGLTLCGFVLLMAMVAFTRIYLGDHWLSDVVAGLIFGIALSLLVATPAARRM